MELVRQKVLGLMGEEIRRAELDDPRLPQIGKVPIPSEFAKADDDLDTGERV